MSTEITVQEQKFNLACRKASALSESSIVPEAYRNNPANCMIALELAERLGVAAIMVMQNMTPIHGKPSWSSSFLISAINKTRKFGTLRFRMTDDPKDGKGCIAWGKDREGEIIEGSPVHMRMAQEEGWIDKKGSKWRTMPDLMLRYRAAAFFCRLNCPEVLNGMHTMDEIEDIDSNDALLAEDELTRAMNDIVDGKKPEETPPGQFDYHEFEEVKPDEATEQELKQQAQGAPNQSILESIPADELPRWKAAYSYYEELAAQSPSQDGSGCILSPAEFVSMVKDGRSEESYLCSIYTGYKMGDLPTQTGSTPEKDSGLI